jgi:putative YphP/YqiW family bacilliredoxin
MYDRELVKPMWQELAQIGVTPLATPDEVDGALKDLKGTAMVMINSVCGCAAGSARPGVAIALQNKKIPDTLYTVFAGVDTEATERARGYIVDMPPSSPSVAILKDGAVAFMLHRSDIEGYTDEQIAKKLTAAFDKHCESEGPSVEWETVLNAFKARGQACGSEFEAR